MINKYYLRNLFLLIFLILSLVSCTKKNSIIKCNILTKSELGFEPLVNSKEEVVILDDYKGTFNFELKHTEYKCEVKFYEKNQGSFINCWDQDFKRGIRSDLTSLHQEDSYKILNTLSVTTESPRVLSTVKVFCE